MPKIKTLSRHLTMQGSAGGVLRLFLGFLGSLIGEFIDLKLNHLTYESVLNH